MKISVIIPCRNEEKYIHSCIDTVLANDCGKENIEILVVDGMSDDTSREIVRSISQQNPQVKLIDNPGKITPLAFNLGITHSTGDYIAIVGARHLIDANYLSTCVKILQSDPQIGCAGGKVQNIYENDTSRIIANAMASSFGVGGRNFRNKAKDSYVDTVGTPVYRRSIFEEVGMFDEALARNQDDEFNFRVLKKGYKIFFTAKTGIRYYVRAAYKNLYRQYFQYGYWKVYVNRKHRTVTTLRQLAPAVFVKFAIVGFLLAFLNKIIAFLYIGILVFYIIVALLAALSTAQKKSGFLQVAWSFLILHWSYGSGYLKGIWHFLILGKKKASETSQRLSR
jgi:glycosyltransferase involved in cell wall biosynthesis